jgi:hypothetical protein
LLEVKDPAPLVKFVSVLRVVGLLVFYQALNACDDSISADAKGGATGNALLTMPWEGWSATSTETGKRQNEPGNLLPLTQGVGFCAMDNPANIDILAPQE